MPIQSAELRPGDPTVEVTGEYRGVLDVTFTDGRVKTVSLRAPDEDEWSAKMLTIQAQVQAQMSRQDAQEAADVGGEILGAYKEASEQEQALAFMRAAYDEEDIYRAYLKFARFNDYRVRNGWSLTQVVTNLASVGLTADEWEEFKTFWQYASNTARVTAMEAYQGVVDGDPR